MGSTVDRFAEEYDEIQTSYVKPEVRAIVRVATAVNEMASWAKEPFPQVNMTLEIERSGRDAAGREARGQLNFVRISYPPKGTTDMKEGARGRQIGMWKRALEALLAPGFKPGSPEAKAAVLEALHAAGDDVAVAILNRRAIVEIGVNRGEFTKNPEKKAKLAAKPQNEVEMWWAATAQNIAKYVDAAPAAGSGPSPVEGPTPQTL